MDKFCISCGMPLAEEAKGKYCGYCADASGNLKPREEIKAGIAMWLERITPDKGSVDFMKRAEYYMSAMPEWAQV